MTKYKYIGKPSTDFDNDSRYTIESAAPAFDYIKFNELSYPIDCEFFLNNFDEETEQDRFHEKLLNVLSDKKISTDS